MGKNNKPQTPKMTRAPGPAAPENRKASTMASAHELTALASYSTPRKFSRQSLTPKLWRVLTTIVAPTQVKVGSLWVVLVGVVGLLAYWI